MEEEERNPNAIQVRKKTCAVWVLLALATVILAAIIAFFVGTNAGECVINGNANGALGAEKPGNKKAEKVRDVRLPRHLEPEKYTVRLVPFIIPDNFTINGYTEILMNCVQSANNVTVHIKNMTIFENRVEVVEVGGPKLSVSGHSYDEAREFYVAHLDEELRYGKQYVIKIWFEGFLQDGLRGFYRSKYKNGRGEEV